MSYTKLTDFASKDALLSGNPSKLLRGTELDAEFDAIQVADALNIKPDTVTAATGKTTPVDADLLTLFDSASTFSLKKLTWANLKATVKTYFDTLYAASGANTDITSLGAAGGIDIIGTNTNDAAAAGYFGEYVSSAVVVSTNFPTANQYGDLTSISLTAGDWDVSVGFFYSLNGSTTSQALCGVSTTSGNSNAGLVAGHTINEVATTFTNGSGIPPVRFSLAATTTVYLKYLANYSAGTPQARGTIRARRVR